MDFVVSKVAMALSALVVLSVMAGAIDDSRFFDRDVEVYRVVSQLASLLEIVSYADSEIELGWRVPMMPTGAELRVVVDGSLVKGETEGFRGTAKPACEFHMWAPTANRLNRSDVEDLDRSAPVLEAMSGETLIIRAMNLVVDSASELLVFVTCRDHAPLANLSASSFTDSVNTSISSRVL